MSGMTVFNMVIVVSLIGLMWLDHGWWDALGVAVACWSAWDLGAEHA